MKTILAFVLINNPIVASFLKIKLVRTTEERDE